MFRSPPCKSGSAAFVLAFVFAACQSDGSPSASGLGPPSVSVALNAADCPAGTNIIEGTAGDDLLVGTPGDDCIIGYGGDDTLIGNSGNDVLVGGDGNDVLEGGNGDDTLFGDDGDDRLLGGNGGDTLSGGSGDDLLDGGNGADNLRGEAGNDTLIGGNGPDSIQGGDGNDIIDAGAGPDDVAAGDGNDVVIGAGGGDTVDGGNGNDACLGNGCESDAPVAGDCSECGADEVCNEAGVCLACLSDSECDDGSVCTTDSCEPLTGCVNTPVTDGTSCSDANVCNGAEACSAGTCVSGAPLDCDDADECTADSCDVEAGCRHTLIDADGDGVGDCRDGCPEDPSKQDPGGCGCGVPDVDSDGDGTLDCNEAPPADLVILQPYSVDGAFRGVFYEVARGQGDALFSNPTDFYPMATALPNGFEWMQWNEYEIADVDGDGRGDLTILQPYSVDGAYRGVFYEVGFGNGDGTFRPSSGFASVATTLPNGSEWMEWTDYSMGDVDADGDADLGIFQPYSVGGGYRGVFVEIALGNGDGTFGPSLGFMELPTTLPNGFEWMQWNEYELGDVDGDGRADVVVFQPFSVDGAYRGVFHEVAFGNGDGTFQPLTHFASIATTLPNGPEWMEWTDYSLGDTTGDGRADIAILQPYSVDGAFSGVFYEIAPSNGDGTFGPVIDQFRSVATTLPNGPEWMEWAQFELGRVLD